MKGKRKDEPLFYGSSEPEPKLGLCIDYLHLTSMIMGYKICETKNGELKPWTPPQSERSLIFILVA